MQGPSQNDPLPVSFTIGGRAQAPLSDNGLFHRVNRLLGLDLPNVDDDG